MDIAAHFAAWLDSGVTGWAGHVSLWLAVFLVLAGGAIPLISLSEGERPLVEPTAWLWFLAVVAFYLAGKVG